MQGWAPAKNYAELIDLIFDCRADLQVWQGVFSHPYDFRFFNHVILKFN